MHCPRQFRTIEEMMVAWGFFDVAIKIKRGKLMRPFAKSRGRQRQRHMRRAYWKSLAFLESVLAERPRMAKEKSE